MVILFIMLGILILIGILYLLLCFFGGTDLHFHHKTKQGEIRITCVGDSITNGALVPNCFGNSYPAKLQQMLGKNYHVENFGLNDRTLQSMGQKPYCKEKEYQRSLAFDPDVVIILLGTNDTKPVSWESKERFASEYRRLIETYRKGERIKKMILCTPPWAMDPQKAIQKITNDSDASVLPDVAETVKMIGKEYGFPVIDLYPLFTDKKELLSFDGLHPNEKGQKLIARKVFERLHSDIC